MSKILDPYLQMNNIQQEVKTIVPTMPPIVTPLRHVIWVAY